MSKRVKRIVVGGERGESPMRHGHLARVGSWFSVASRRHDLEAVASNAQPLVRTTGRTPVPRCAVAALGVALLLAAGCRTASDEHRPAGIARFYLETDASHGVPVVLPRSGVPIMIGAKPVFTEYDVTHVEVADVELGRCLRFQLTGEAARDLRRMVQVYPGRRLVLLLNGEPLGARRIDASLGEGAILVFVELPDEELPQWAEGLQQTTVQLRRSAKPW